MLIVFNESSIIWIKIGGNRSVSWNVLWNLKEANISGSGAKIK